MKIFKHFLLILAGIGVLLIAFIWYSGFFRSVEVEIRDAGPFVAVYEKHKGDYRGTAEVQEKLYNRLWDDGIENYRSFAVFFDDPSEVPVNQLQSLVGCIVESGYESKVRSMQDKYQIFDFEKQKCAVVEFPYRNNFSMFAAVSKAYPELDEYLEKNKLKPRPVIEVYHIPENIIFLMPLRKDISIPGYEKNN